MHLLSNSIKYIERIYRNRCVFFPFIAKTVSLREEIRILSIIPNYFKLF